MSSYLRVRTKGFTDPTGFKLLIDDIRGLDLSGGYDSLDISLPQSTTRTLIPTSGLKRDLTFEIDIVDDGTNKGIEIDNTGTEIGLGLLNTNDIFKFIEEDILSGNINSSYTFYIEWLNKIYQGSVNIRIVVDSESFFSKITLSITFKEGGNIFGVF